jgi:chorismate mutase
MHCCRWHGEWGREAHISAAGSRNTDWHRAVSATPAQVAVTGALEAVAPATAVVQLPQAHQQARVLAQVNVVRAVVQACIQLLL